jgi:hypothetical protein
MAKSNNEDDGGWEELERWANEPDETDLSNASKPLSASEQAALIEESTPKVRTFWRGSVKMICDAAAECARTAKRLDAEHKKLYVKKLQFGKYGVQYVEADRRGQTHSEKCQASVA